MIRSDCLRFKGEKPCAFSLSCAECSEYEPLREKTLLIKRAAMGDVLRTTSLLPGLKRKRPRSSIFWVVDPESVELLENNPFIDRIIPFTPENWLPLFVQKFDTLICLDKDPGSTALATKIPCPRKFGFGMNEHGNLSVLNPASEYALRLGIDDDLKFRTNRKTYQEIICEVAEVPYQGDPYVLALSEDDRRKAGDFFRRRRIDRTKPSIGLNTGAGTKFETKQWPPPHFRRLIHLLSSKIDANVFLLGGRREEGMNRALGRTGSKRVYNTGNDHSLREFAGFIEAMDIVVSSDSLGMHLAIALGKKVIALFGPTCPQEISLYGRGAAVFAETPCSPCYKSTCPDMTCMAAITPERVFEEIRKIL